MSGHSNTVTPFIFEGQDIRGSLVLLSDAWQAMLRERGYTPPVESLLGEMAAVAALIGSHLKTPARLTLQAQGSGEVSLLVVDCNEQLQLRGMAKSRGATNAMHATPRQLLGDGRLSLSLQNDAASQPYQSTVPLAGESIAEIFEHYLAQSEQQPARLWLSADSRHAAGLFLQTLPARGDMSHPARDAHDGPDADCWNRIQLLAATVRPGELLLPAATLLPRLFPEETLRLFEPRPVTYHCPRDEDKVRGMLAALGRAELESILAEHSQILIRDDICNQEYRFGGSIVAELFPSAGKTLH